MRISIFQFAPMPGEVDLNLERALDAVKGSAEKGADLILLPELWPCGIVTHKERCPADRTERIIASLRDMALQHNITIAGGMPEQDKADRSTLYNTLFIVNPDGSMASYRKIHLFSPMGEDMVFTAGRNPATFSIKYGTAKVTAGAAICYDLRFPQLARQLATEGAEVILVPALWPMARRGHLELLSAARAVENQCFVVLANGYGMSGDTELAGASAIYAPDGRPILLAEDREGVFTKDIDLSEIALAREKFLTAIPEKIWSAGPDGKLLELKKLLEITGARKKAGQKMVFTNGCFDILHPGHTAYLEEARNCGDFLVLGLNSDDSVKRLKGPSRPVNTERARAAVLSALSSVDYITIFSEDTPLELIKALCPDILVKGADWDEEKIAGADVVKQAGGQVRLVPFVHDTSTSDTIARIMEKSQGRFPIISP
jgi:rfaE bifunctional protein nucleotidyltransferase chain/domain